MVPLEFALAYGLWSRDCCEEGTLWDGNEQGSGPWYGTAL